MIREKSATDRRLRTTSRTNKIMVNRDAFADVVACWHARVKKPEKLLAYGARGAFSHERPSLKDPTDEKSDLIYTLKTRWTDGTEAILISAPGLLEKIDRPDSPAVHSYEPVLWRLVACNRFWWRRSTRALAVPQLSRRCVQNIRKRIKFLNKTFFRSLWARRLHAGCRHIPSPDRA